MSDCAKSYNSLSDNKLAQLVKNGGDNALNELSMRYISIIRFIARRFSAQGYELNDFVQEGLLGLLYSCKTYDENGASSFKSYMSLIVERRFISIIRKSNAQKAVPDSAIIKIDDLTDEIEDFTQNPEDLIVYKDYLDAVFKKLESLLSKSEYVILMLYGNGLSYKEIAKRRSISEKSADNALQRARRKICSIKDMS
jgi:RNA polymerase sporulation-specific sigma factor